MDSSIDFKDQEQELIGYIDSIDYNSITGWGFDPKSPTKPLLVKVTVGTQVKTVVADIFRADLLDAGKGDGKHGFCALLDHEIPENASVKVQFANNTHLTNSPTKASISYSLNSPQKAKVLARLINELQNSAAGMSAFFKEGEEHTVNLDSTVRVSNKYPTRAKIAKIFETAVPDHDPEGIVSKYIHYEVTRMKLDNVLSVDGTLSERMKTLDWYLRDYGPRRGHQLPLSQQQIKYLNSPVGVLGLNFETSIAAYSFIKSELGENRNLNDENQRKECLYWWCFERAPQITPNGELITDSQIREIAHSSPYEVGLRFPLNYFCRRYHQLDVSLHSLDLHSWIDRAVFICILLLRSVQNPLIIKFLPSVSIGEIFNTNNTETLSAMDRIVSTAIESSLFENFYNINYSQFRGMMEKFLTLNNFNINLGGIVPSFSARESALSLTLSKHFPQTPEKGIAVIGPIHATSGLGQATRLSLDVLKASGRVPYAVDFGMDNPAPKGFASEFSVENATSPKEINLFHLNAEAIPLAAAYLSSSLYENSYNIGYFFWELDVIPKCHYLALDFLDEIWVSSEYNKEIYEKYASIPVRNVGMAVEPLPEAANVSRSVFGIDQESFVFLATFDSFSFVERKNPLGTIAAFQQAFPTGTKENVSLILKTQNRTKVFDPHQLKVWRQIDSIISKDTRIKIVDQTLSYSNLLGFKKLCDAYVSLHRSEGWGFGMIEAMQLKLPVVTTAYSGNMEFCSNKTAFLIDFDLVQPDPSEYIFVERGSRWAEPHISSGAKAMRSLFENRDIGAVKAQAAFDLVSSKFSLGSISERYNSRLSEIEKIISEKS